MRKETQIVKLTMQSSKNNFEMLFHEKNSLLQYSLLDECPFIRENLLLSKNNDKHYLNFKLLIMNDH